ncbi:MAG: hypothetical protein AAF497_21570, partial [Planctomycetota bacterium]
MRKRKHVIQFRKRETVRHLEATSIVLVICMVLMLATVMETRICAQTAVTFDAAARRGIGGVSTIDRARYFNYHGTLMPGTTALRQSVYAEDGLNASPGRVSSELDQGISQGLPEDPSNPGFFEPNALRNELRGSYRDFVLNGSRYEAYRNAPNPQMIQSGRAASFWPTFLRTDPVTGVTDSSLPLNVAGYANFLNTYLDEVVYGPNAFHPVSPDRFYIEVVNEPNVHFGSNFSVQDMIDMHVDVSQMVKAEHPAAKVGGYSACCSDFVGDDFERWFDELQPFIAQAGNEMDFVSIHPYDRYTVNFNGTYQ